MCALELCIFERNNETARQKTETRDRERETEILYFGYIRCVCTILQVALTFQRYLYCYQPPQYGVVVTLVKCIYETARLERVLPSVSPKHTKDFIYNNNNVSTVHKGQPEKKCRYGEPYMSSML